MTAEAFFAKLDTIKSGPKQAGRLSRAEERDYNPRHRKGAVVLRPEQIHDFVFYAGEHGFEIPHAWQISPRRFVFVFSKRM